MVLHIISCSPTTGSGAFAAGFKIASVSDAILLTGNAVYAALPHGEQHPLIELAPCPVYALKDDLQARGVVGVSDAITVIEHPQWVQLTVEHEKSISWFE